MGKLTATHWLGIISFFVFAAVFNVLKLQSPGTPDCDNPTVKGLVMDISAKELKKGIVNVLIHGISFEGAFGETGVQLGDLRKEMERDKEMGIGLRQFSSRLRGGEGISYEELNELKVKTGNKVLQEAISTHVDQPIASLSNSGLINIRTNEKQADIKKVSCSADISFPNGNTLPIGYTAQITEDGKLYAEVSGLK
jgi:hypothetical protein